MRSGHLLGQEQLEAKRIQRQSQPVELHIANLPDGSRLFRRGTAVFAAGALPRGSCRAWVGVHMSADGALGCPGATVLGCKGSSPDGFSGLTLRVLVANSGESVRLSLSAAKIRLQLRDASWVRPWSSAEGGLYDSVCPPSATASLSAVPTSRRARQHTHVNWAVLVQERSFVSLRVFAGMHRAERRARKRADDKRCAMFRERRLDRVPAHLLHPSLQSRAPSSAEIVGAGAAGATTPASPTPPLLCTHMLADAHPCSP